MPEDSRPRSIVIVSDVHLGHRPCDHVAADLARLVGDHPGHEIVFNGDTFNLSCDPRGVDPGRSVVSAIAAHPRFESALRAHLASGGALTWLAGNHDLDVQVASCRERLHEWLAVSSGTRSSLAVEPWFVRRGDVHIEHGHLHDPRHAPAHSLGSPSYETEPLGVALSRRSSGV